MIIVTIWGDIFRGRCRDAIFCVSDNVIDAIVWGVMQGKVKASSYINKHIIKLYLSY